MFKNITNVRSVAKFMRAKWLAMFNVNVSMKNALKNM